MVLCVIVVAYTLVWLGALRQVLQGPGCLDVVIHRLQKSTVLEFL